MSGYHYDGFTIYEDGTDVPVYDEIADRDEAIRLLIRMLIANDKHEDEIISLRDRLERIARIKQQNEAVFAQICKDKDAIIEKYQWIFCTERYPTEKGVYLWAVPHSSGKGFFYTTSYFDPAWLPFSEHHSYAWMLIPELPEKQG